MPCVSSPDHIIFIKEGDIMKAKPKHFIPRPESVVCLFLFQLLENSELTTFIPF